MKPIYAIVIVAAVFIAAIAGGWALKAALLPVKTVVTQIDSAGNIIDITYDAENAIYNYEWFKTQYEKISATERVIRNTRAEMDSYRELYEDPTAWDWQTRQDYNSLQRRSLGQQNYYEELVAMYNARSKMANREIFKDKLPLHVDKMIW